MSKCPLPTTLLLALTFPASVRAQPFGDHNLDGAVDQADVAGLAACAADLNGDDKIDGLDIGLFVQALT